MDDAGMEGEGMGQPALTFSILGAQDVVYALKPWD